MQRIKLDRPREGFEIVARNARSEAATMVLGAGDSTGGPQNRHPDSDQWLLVLDGEGEAIVNGQKVSLGEGTLLLIEAGESHEIRNCGQGRLATLNVYAPPAYYY